MKTSARQPGRNGTPAVAGRRRRAGVTMLELMVAMTLISFIILVLYEMFDRTQQQMRRAVNQVDVLESGRAALDVIARDMSQMVAPRAPFTSGFYMDNVPAANAVVMYDAYTNIVQTNTLQRCLFQMYDLQSSPTNWSGIGFQVTTPTNHFAASPYGMGTLYRFATNANLPSGWFPYSFFSNGLATSFQRIADHVVHFRVRPVTNSVAVPGIFLNLPSTQIPSHLEIELGYLDPATAELALSMGNNANIANFISRQADKVQLFRIQVPVRAGLQ